jgi:glycerol-3-phosphate dehydrogenase
MRESIAERSVWLRIAPHLVEPVPVLIPTYGRGLQRTLIRAGASLADAVGWDRNRGLGPGRRLPAAYAVSRAGALELVPEFEPRGLTGGVVFYDAQIYNSERLVLEVVQAASKAGAVVANYVEFAGGVSAKGRLVGARVTDVVGAESFEVRAGWIVNAAGGAAPKVAAALTGWPLAGVDRYVLALNVMAPPRGHLVAFSLAGTARDPDAKLRLGPRRFFFVPWRDRLLIGTGYYGHPGDPTTSRFNPAHVESFLDEINAVWPGEPFDAAEIALVHSGMLPVKGGVGSSVQFLKRHRVIDHAAHGVPNALTVVTGKYTTARRAAQDVVDRIMRSLGRKGPPCTTHNTPLPGAWTDEGRVVSSARARLSGALDVAAIHHLVRTYGRGFERVLSSSQEVESWHLKPVSSEPVILAQWVHAIREEMALRAEDLVWRRTELGAKGLASPPVMELAARTLESERARNRACRTS